VLWSALFRNRISLFSYGIPLAGFGPLALWRYEEAPEEALPRTFLSFLAILEALWAYPVAGSQIACSTFLTVVAATWCFRDSLVLLWQQVAASAPKINALFPRMAGLVLSCWVLVTLYYFLWISRDQYQSLQPLNLPGARRIHLSFPQAQALRLITANLVRNADALVTIPGMYSFQLWTGIEPLTDCNVTFWMKVLSAPQQEEIIHQLAQHPRACVVVNPHKVEGWANGYDISRAPLFGYLTEKFHRYGNNIGDYFILIRKDRDRQDFHIVQLKDLPASTSQTTVPATPLQNNR
jgi:hypothetical protein